MVFALRLGHPAGPDAGGTDPYALNMPVLNRADPLKVGIPAGFALIVCVAHIVADPGSFAAYFTHSRHVEVSFETKFSPLGQPEGQHPNRGRGKRDSLKIT